MSDEHRPSMDELQATFAAQAEAAKEFELKHLALKHASVRDLLEEVASLRAKLASKKAK
jgi:hypothetical protein